MQNIRVLRTAKYIKNIERIIINVPFYSVPSPSIPFELFVEWSFFKNCKIKEVISEIMHLFDFV